MAITRIHESTDNDLLKLQKLLAEDGREPYKTDILALAVKKLLHSVERSHARKLKTT